MSKYDSGTMFWYEVVAPAFQRILDVLLPHASRPDSVAHSVANDYFPANALYNLIGEAVELGVVIPESLYDDAERVVAEDGYAEDYMLDSIRMYRAEHYPTPA